MVRCKEKYETDSPTDYRWTVSAFEALEAGTLKAGIERVGDNRVAWVSGFCPRCDGPLEGLRRLLDGSRGATGTLGDTDKAQNHFVPLDVQCSCGHDHDGAPQDTVGCGISFRVELEDGS